MLIPIPMSCMYDALGNRIQVNDAGAVTKFVYDPVGMSDLAAEYDSAGQLLRRYIHADVLVADESPAKERRYYHADHLSSMHLLTSEAGSVVGKQSYAAFGAIQSSKGETTRFGYVGGLGVQTDSTGLLYMRNRYYDPQLGKFIQSDSIGLSAGDVNFYRYCGNNPVCCIDPNGQNVAVAVLGTTVFLVGTALYLSWMTTNMALNIDPFNIPKINTSDINFNNPFSDPCKVDPDSDACRIAREKNVSDQISSEEEIKKSQKKGVDELNKEMEAEKKQLEAVKNELNKESGPHKLDISF